MRAVRPILAITFATLYASVACFGPTFHSLQCGAEHSNCCTLTATMRGHSHAHESSPAVACADHSHESLSHESHEHGRAELASHGTNADPSHDHASGSHEPDQAPSRGPSHDDAHCWVCHVLGQAQQVQLCVEAPTSSQSVFVLPSLARQRAEAEFCAGFLSRGPPCI